MLLIESIHTTKCTLACFFLTFHVDIDKLLGCRIIELPNHMAFIEDITEILLSGVSITEVANAFILQYVTLKFSGLKRTIFCS